MRRFVCEGFYFMGDFAVPMFFTVLTMWPEVLPMQTECLGKTFSIINKCFTKVVINSTINNDILTTLIHINIKSVFKILYVDPTNKGRPL